MSKILLSELAIYPVKSFSQIQLNESIVDQFGLQNDRRWMLVDQHGRYITQRQQSRMCLICVKLINNGIQLSVPQKSSLTVVKPKTLKTVLVRIWHDECHVLDCGDEAAAWLSEFLSIKCRLVYFPDNEFRQVDQKYANFNDRTAFSDGFPLLLISQASLDDLNNKLDVALPMKRFRPNLVVSGCEAFAEDSWKRIRIAHVDLRVVKPCSRCVIPSINTQSAERGKEPLKTLMTYRKRENKIYFGQNVIADTQAELKTGMMVEILE